MNHSFHSSGNTGILSLAGTLSIEHGAELKASISAALEAAENVVFDLSEVASADICCLQLLCAAHRASVSSGKRFIACGMANEIVKNAAEVAGFPRHVGCVEDVDKTCIWVGGKN